MRLAPWSGLRPVGRPRWVALGGSSVIRGRAALEAPVLSDGAWYAWDSFRQAQGNNRNQTAKGLMLRGELQNPSPLAVYSVGVDGGKRRVGLQLPVAAGGKSGDDTMLQFAGFRVAAALPPRSVRYANDYPHPPNTHRNLDPGGHGRMLDADFTYSGIARGDQCYRPRIWLGP